MMSCRDITLLCLQNRQIIDMDYDHILIAIYFQVHSTMTQARLKVVSCERTVAISRALHGH